MKLIGTSWKMNNDIPKTEKYIKTLLKNKKILKKKNNFFIIPPFTSLSTFKKYLNELPIILGAQNIHHEDSGAFTGEISASMIKSCGCKIVELGHAERFEYFNESDILINKKIIQALKYDITPLVCVGEKKFNSNFNLRKQGLRKKLNIFLKNISLKKIKKLF